jgi:hypothetical protein
MQFQSIYHFCCTHDTLMGIWTNNAISNLSKRFRDDQRVKDEGAGGVGNKGKRSAQWWEPQLVVERELHNVCVNAVAIAPTSKSTGH